MVAAGSSFDEIARKRILHDSSLYEDETIRPVIGKSKTFLPHYETIRNSGKSTHHYGRKILEFGADNRGGNTSEILKILAPRNTFVATDSIPSSVSLRKNFESKQQNIRVLIASVEEQINLYTDRMHGKRARGCLDNLRLKDMDGIFLLNSFPFNLGFEAQPYKKLETIAKNCHYMLREEGVLAVSSMHIVRSAKTSAFYNALQEKALKKLYHPYIYLSLPKEHNIRREYRDAHYKITKERSFSRSNQKNIFSLKEPREKKSFKELSLDDYIRTFEKVGFEILSETREVLFNGDAIRGMILYDDHFSSSVLMQEGRKPKKLTRLEHFLVKYFFASSVNDALDELGYDTVPHKVTVIIGFKERRRRSF